MKRYHEDALNEERSRNGGPEAAEHIPGPNPAVGVRGKGIFEKAGRLIKQALKQLPLVLTRRLKFATETARIADRSSHPALDATEETTINVNGTRVHVAIRRGDSSIPPLLLFNGIGANLEVFDAFIETLE